MPNLLLGQHHLPPLTLRALKLELELEPGLSLALLAGYVRLAASRLWT